MIKKKKQKKKRKNALTGRLMRAVVRIVISLHYQWECTL